MDHGNCTRDRGLEIQACIGLTSSFKKLWTTRGNQCLVSCNNSTSIAQGSHHIVKGGFNPTDQFDNNVFSIDHRIRIR